MHRSPRSLLLVAVLVGCSTPSEPAVAETGLEGTYIATEFTTRTAGGTIDRLAEGVRMTLTLGADSSIVGVVIAPSGTANVVGTWDIVDGLIHFHEDNANFLRQIPFRVVGKQLRGDALLGVTTYGITLTRTTVIER